VIGPVGVVTRTTVAAANPNNGDVPGLHARHFLMWG
jgi:hypothetical protein